MHCGIPNCPKSAQVPSGAYLIKKNKKKQTFYHFFIIIKGQCLHFISTGNSYFHPLKHSKMRTHMREERERERAWICFFTCDEKDYGIKDAMPCQLSSVWTKAAPSGSTMANTDECLLPRWRRAQLPQLL